MKTINLDVTAKYFSHDSITTYEFRVIYFQLPINIEYFNSNKQEIYILNLEDINSQSLKTLYIDIDNNVQNDISLYRFDNLNDICIRGDSVNLKPKIYLTKKQSKIVKQKLWIKKIIPDENDAIHSFQQSLVSILSISFNCKIPSKINSYYRFIHSIETIKVLSNQIEFPIDKK